MGKSFHSAFAVLHMMHDAPFYSGVISLTTVLGLLCVAQDADAVRHE